MCREGLYEHTYNKVKARAVAEIARLKKWDVVQLHEIRSESRGVEWFGVGENSIAIIHSEKTGILLRGKLLRVWSEENQRRIQDERTISDIISKVVYTSGSWEKRWWEAGAYTGFWPGGDKILCVARNIFLPPPGRSFAPPWSFFAPIIENFLF